MTKIHHELMPAIFEGWHTYQGAIIETLGPLNEAQLDLRAAPEQRSVGQIAKHIISSRAFWFYLLMGEGGNEFKSLSKWSQGNGPARSAEELIHGLQRTWQGMQVAIASWSEEDWGKTWEGVGDDEPEIITRGWVIWHLIEHDLHHGGEISLTLGVHGISAFNL